MYEGAYAQKRKPVRRRRRRTQRPTLLLAALVLIFGALVGSTVAFLVAGTQTVTNQFKPTKVTTTITEDFPDHKVKNNVKVQNTGEIPAYIRAAVVVTWQNDAGQVYAQTPVEETDYTLSWNTTDWFQEGDFWYYKSAVNANASTNYLLTDCKLKEGVTPPKDYYLCVEILASAIQSEPASAVEDAWPVTVGTGGTLSAKGGN